MKLNAEAGFSLMELVLVLMLLSILSIGFARYFGQTFDAWRWTADQSGRSGTARSALDRIVRGVTEMDPPAEGLLVMNAHAISYAEASGEIERIEWSGIPGDMIYYSTSEGTYPLCAGVDSLGFSYYDAAGALATSPSDVWRVGLTLRVGDALHPVTYRTSVHVRNH